MADYYPLIAKAVAALDKSTGEARRSVYERARTALVGQLRNMTPPLSESEITRERLALEEAIRKVEAEAARRMRMDPKNGASSGRAAETQSPPPAPQSPQSAPQNPQQNPQSPQQNPQAPQPSAAPIPPRPALAPTPPRAPRGQEPPPPSGGAAPSPDPNSRFEIPPRPPRNRPFERSQLSDQGLRGFRDVVAEAESLGDKTAQTSRSARAAYAAVPANVPELDRMEPRVEPEGLRTPPREQPSARPSPPRNEQRPPGAPPAPPPRAFPEPAPPPAPLEQRRKEPASRKGMIAVILTLLVILGLAVALFVMRDRIPGWIGTVRSLAPQTQKDAPRPKIPDRVGQEGQTATAPAAPKDQGAPQSAAVAQRVVLYEEDPSDPAGKRYVGSALWRTEMVTPVQGQPQELAVRCDVEIPDRRLGMTMSVRRNTDPNLPASHTIEIMFNLPADFPFGGINNVPGILMKQAEQTRGSPLAGLAVKVTTGFFLIGLSATETDMQRNVELLKERAWFDIPVVYNNGRRAILAVEKGNPGEKAFSDAFAAWKQ